MPESKIGFAVNRIRLNSVNPRTDGGTHGIVSNVFFGTLAKADHANFGYAPTLINFFIRQTGFAGDV